MTQRTDHPSAQELLEAVEEFLRDKVMPATEGHLNFHTRVAANALATVRRELDQGPDAAERERAGMARLLARDGSMEELTRAFCEAIEAGEIAVNDPALLDHLRQTAIDRIAVDNPKYASYRREIGES